MADGSGDDNTDARGIFGKFFYRTSKPKIEPVIVHGVNEDEYPMEKYSKRGKCYIFNHKKFESHTGLNVRNGTDADAARLFCRFKDLGFDTEVFQDFKVKQVIDKLEEAGKQNHNDESCFVCCILSHGEFGFLYASDGKYPTEKVFAPFRGDVCTSLVGKPKMFFIQACQGDKLDSGVPCRDQLDADFDFKIPTHADFLAVYSSVPGFYSWRNTTNGSWFIQALCAVISKRAKNKDILSILTIVNREVALNFESCTPQDESMHKKKQVPFVTHTLTRDVRFPH